MNDRVIYTCITGGYDNLKQPCFIYENYDYICFSNSIKERQIGVWQIRPISYKNADNTRVARYVKHNPHIVVSEYKYSIWIDSNVQIIDNYLNERVNLMINQGSLIATINHPDKDCIYDDAKACIATRNERFILIYRQVMLMCKENYPRHNGLYETNVLYREHNNTIVVDFSISWWNMITKYSKRDQLSQCYLIWKKNIKVNELFPNGINTYSKDHFVRRAHVNNTRSLFKRVKRRVSYYTTLIIYIPFYIRMIYAIRKTEKL